MDRRFLVIVGVSSLATFGAVLFVPAPSISQSPWAAPIVPHIAYYPNCAAARSAGVAPIYRGQPGYRPGLDADFDGIACEPYGSDRGIRPPGRFH